MRYWSFNEQMKYGLLLMVGLFICGSLTRDGRWFNLAWMLYGLLWLLHPVLPEQAAQTSRTLNVVRICGALILLVGAISRFGL